MEAPLLKPPYQDDHKNRVWLYFHKNREGNYNDFIENGKEKWNIHRPSQVPRHKFDQVYRDMQKKGEIPMILGGKAHMELLRDIEKQALKKAEQKLVEQGRVTPAPPSDFTPVGAPAPAPEPVSHPQPVPENHPPSPSTLKEEPVVAKELGIKELTDEQRDKLIKAIRKDNDITYEEAERVVNCRLIKANFQSYRYLVKTRGARTSDEKHNGVSISATLPSLPKNAPAVPRTRGLNGHTAPAAAPASLGVSAILDPNIVIKNPQILGRKIDCEGMEEKDWRVLRKYLPSALADIFSSQERGTTMKFNVSLVLDEGHDGKDIPKLQVTRIA
jgi:hypothetical protein